MQKFKCHVCGKTISSGRSIEPCPEAPEIKKTVYFCSTRCMNVFVGSVRRNRTKSKIKLIRSELENAEHEPSDKELSLLLGTLTPKEKDLLSQKIRNSETVMENNRNGKNESINFISTT